LWAVPSSDELARKLRDEDAAFEQQPRELRRFEGHAGVAGVVAFSPDGKRIVTADSKTVRVWDAGTGKELKRFDAQDEFVIASMAFSADGRFLLAGGGMHEPRTNRPIDLEAHVWDLQTGQEVRLRGHPLRIRDVALSADGRQALTCSNDRTVRLWDAR